MKREEAIAIIEKHNEGINHFINVELAQILGAKDGKITLDKYFKAQGIIREQGFYEKAKEICDMLRRNDFDCKINMQSNELVLY